MSLSLASRYLLLSVALLWCGVSSLLAAPVVNQVSLRGLQVGGTTTLTLNGNDLLSETRLLAPFAVAKQELLPGATAKQVQLRITLAGDVRPGLFAVRLTSSQGISAPFMLGVDALPQQSITEQINALPIAMTGSLAGGQIIKASFVGQKGLPLVVDVEAQRLGANFKPVARLYNGRGQQVAWSAPQPLIGGDARLSLTLPADDTYTIELHDLLYRAAGPGFFRLKVGALTYADFALPLAVAKGTTSNVRYASTNTPAGLTTAIDAAALTIPTEQVTLAPPAALFSGAAPRVQISDSAEAIETAPAAGQKQLLGNLPCAVSGTIASKGEEDQYLVAVKPGQKLRMAVTARRLGSLLDGLLIVRNAAGNELARNDDQPGTADPGLEFTVPAGVEQLLLCVRDMEQRFGEAFVYRLAIHEAAAPDVVATVNLDTLQIPAGGTLVVPVTVVRTNYAGPLRITAENAVGNITLGGAEIPANATTTLLTLTAAGGQPVHGVMNLVIRASDANVPLARYVLTPENNITRYQPALRHDLGLAIVAPGPISIRWNASVEAEKEFLGAKLPLALSITRAASATGDVRLRLMSTQPIPKKKIKENNKDKEVDDLERSLRLVEGQPVFKADNNEPRVHLQIPADLPAQPWGVLVVAELLSPDGKQVIATGTSSLRTIQPTAPFTLELTSSPQAEGKAGLGETGKLTGKIVRNAGFQQPVIISLAGLPAEVKQVPQVMLAAEQTEFVLPLSFEYGSKLGEFKAIKLTATVSGANAPSGAANVDLKIVAGDKPQ